MRVLIGCEFSGVVRRAFRERGHEAYSCDILPAEDGSEHHYQADVLDIIKLGWDMAIFHPPCTFLSLSGVRWLYGGKGKVRDSVRWSQMEAAAAFFKALLTSSIERVCVENPIPHGHAGLPKYSQIIQPWQFGEPETKATCLWLKGLPLLVPTNIVAGRAPRVHHASPGADRWKERSRTIIGIANAMANQWGAP